MASIVDIGLSTVVLQQCGAILFSLFELMARVGIFTMHLISCNYAKWNVLLSLLRSVSIKSQLANITALNLYQHLDSEPRPKC